MKNIKNICIFLAVVISVTSFLSFQENVKSMDNVLYLTGANYLHDNEYTGAYLSENEKYGQNVEHAVYEDHPEFFDRIINFNGIPNGGDPTDDTGHGTCTFGEIYSKGIDSKAKGMLPDGIGIFYDYNSNWRYWEALEETIGSYDVVFQSGYSFDFGSGPPYGDYTTESEDYDQAAWDNPYVTLLHLCGNNFEFNVDQKAVAKNIISCGSVIHENNLIKTDDSFSNWFSLGCDDERIKPDLVAPGDPSLHRPGVIYTPWYQYNHNDELQLYRENFGGTSAACPIISGAVGLVYDMFLKNDIDSNLWQDNWHKRTSDTSNVPYASTVKALLINHAYQYQITQDIKRINQGWGLVNIGKIYFFASTDIVYDCFYELSDGETWSPEKVQLIEGEKLKVTLVWTDTPGKTSDTQNLLNDLDLKVEGPSGQNSKTYYGNYGLIDIPSNNPSNWINSEYTVSIWSDYVTDTNIEEPDRLNNVENVFIDDAEPGEYTITVKAHNFNGLSSQDFSLIISVDNNNIPENLGSPSGETNGETGVEYEYSIACTDLDGDQLYYLWDWGNEFGNKWHGPYDSGDTCSVFHSWSNDGEYQIRVKTRDGSGDESEWSHPLTVAMPHPYQQGIPELSYTPGYYNLGNVIQNNNNFTSFIIINNGSGGTLEYTISESFNYINVNPTQGLTQNENETINVYINTENLEEGNYECDLNIISNGGNGCFTLEFYVNQQIPILQINKGVLDFGSMIPDSIATDTFEIWNGGYENLTYTIQENCNWIEVSPLSGDSNGEQDTITVEVNTLGLTSGQYQYAIDIISNGGNDTITVSVNVNEPTGGEELSYSPHVYDFELIEGGQLYQTTFDIWNSGTGTLSWELSDDCPWLSYSPTTGSSSGEIQTVTVTIDTSGLPPDSYYDHLTITSNGGYGSFSVLFITYYSLLANYNWVDEDGMGPGTIVVFNASCSFGYDITLYEWDWNDDGIYDYSDTNPIVSYDYENYNSQTCRLRIEDPYDQYSIRVKNVNAEINYPPSQPIVDITPDNAESDDNLICSVTTISNDPDNDNIFYKYEWFMDDTLIQTNGPTSDISNILHSTETINSSTYSCTVSPFDGKEYGPPSTDYVTINNTPPQVPNTPEGSSSGEVGESLTFSTSAVDPESNDIRYGWDWNDDDFVDEWTDYSASGSESFINHEWLIPGIYSIKVKAEDINGEQSSFSGIKTIDILEDSSEPISIWPMYQYDAENTGYIPCRGDVFSPVLEWTVDIDYTIKWSSPTIVDVDNDGIAEIFVGRSEYSDFFCLYGNNGSIKWQYNCDNVESTAAVADIDGDGEFEIVFGSFYNKIHCLNSNGGVEWIYETPGYIQRSSAVVCDVIDNGQNVLEVIICTKAPYSKSYCINGATGELIWNTTMNSITSSVAVGNVDGGGSLEIIFGCNDGSIRCLDSVTGNEKWMFDTDGTIESSPSIGDVDGDGNKEIIIGSNDKKIYCLSGSNGNEKWNTSIDDECDVAPSIADVNYDGIMEIFIGDHNGKIYCLNGSNGFIKWMFLLTEPECIYGSSPVLADIDSDGIIEMLIGSYSHTTADAHCYCFNSMNGTLEWTLDTDRSLTSPALGDVDGDGKLEIILCSYYGKIYCIDGNDYPIDVPTLPTVDITPELPITSDDLICTILEESIDPGNVSNPVRYFYDWYKIGNSNPIKSVGPTFSIYDILDSSMTISGFNYKCIVTPNDGLENGTSAEDRVIINSLPSTPVVDVKPDNPGIIHDLTCTVVNESIDSNSIYFALPVSGTDDYPWSETWYSPIYIKNFHCQISNNIDLHLKYKKLDGSWYEFDGLEGPNGWVTGGSYTFVINDYTYGIILNGYLPAGYDCTITWDWYTDSDGSECYSIGYDNGYTFVNYTYEWFEDDNPVAIQSSGLTSNLSDVLNASSTVIGSSYMCVVTPYDGLEYGVSANDSVTVVNQLPSQPTISVTPEDPISTNNIICTITAESTDVDPDDSIEYLFEWFEEGNLIQSSNLTSNLSDVLNASSTVIGSNYMCIVTPYDGLDYGVSANDSVTIINQLPSQPTVDVTPDNPISTDNLTCTITTESTDPDGDSVEYIFDWFKDDEPVAIQSSDFTSNLSDVLNASSTIIGSSYMCLVTPNDGIENGSSANDSVIIVNQLPSQPTVDVTPDNPISTDNLNCTISVISVDPDGDSVEYMFEWFEDGNLIQSSGLTSNVSHILDASSTIIGSSYMCLVTPNDGIENGSSANDSVIIVNQLPSQPTVDVTPDNPISTDNLTCTITTESTDPDGDSVEYIFDWFKDDEPVAIQSSGLTFNLSDVLNATSTIVGSTYNCVVTPYDGIEYGYSANDSVTIVNQLPSQSTVDVTPDNPISTDNLTCTITTESTDPDGDSVEYIFDWFKDDNPTPIQSSGLTNALFDVLNSTETVIDSSYTCVVTPFDGLENGSSCNDSVTVTNQSEVLDINQSVFDRGFPIRHAADGDWACAQTFKPTINSLTKVEIYIREFGTPEFNLTVELRTEHPQGTLLDTIIITPDEIENGIWNWLTIDFDDISVTPGNTYFVVCPPAPSGVTTSFGYEWGYALNDVYDDGVFWFTRDGGGLWRDLPTMYECVFKTYGCT